MNKYMRFIFTLAFFILSCRAESKIFFANIESAWNNSLVSSKSSWEIDLSISDGEEDPSFLILDLRYCFKFKFNPIDRYSI